MLGYNKKQLLGKNVNILIPEPFSKVHDSYVTNYVRNGEEQCGLGSRYERRHDLYQLRARR